MRSRQANLLRLVERLLWILATTTIGLFVVVSADGRLYQLYLNWKFDTAMHARQTTERTRPNSESRPDRAPVAEQQPASATTTQPAPVDLEPPGSVVPRQPVLPFLGRLQIPRLDMSIMLLEGIDGATLRRGIGHIPGTAMPGEGGNTGIAGHRDTFFRGLSGIRRNDQITIQTLHSEYHYVVDSIMVVNPEYVNVLRDPGRPVLTLVTCYPFQLVGPAPKRFVVQASLTE
jgi:LPXTG-site transpeptidase (sortase) family protein